MALRVQLHRNVTNFLLLSCSDRERVAFYEQLHAVRSNPISLSEALMDSSIAPHALRSFDFANCRAAFELDIAKNQIRVLACRRKRPPSKRPSRDAAL